MRMKCSGTVRHIHIVMSLQFYREKNFCGCDTIKYLSIIVIILLCFKTIIKLSPAPGLYFLTSAGQRLCCSFSGQRGLVWDNGNPAITEGRLATEYDTRK